MKTLSTPQSVPRKAIGGFTVLELLKAITPQQERQLAAFARRRLRRAAVTPWLQRQCATISAEDLVQSAKAKVLLGEQSPHGRRLKPRNLAKVEVFLVCLRRIIESDVSSLLKTARHQGEHVSIGDSSSDTGTVDPPDPLVPTDHLIRRDLRQVVFRRLREAIATEPELLPVLEQWEAGFLTYDRIAPGELDRKPAHRLRLLVRAILQELAGELSLAPVTGKEMVL